MNISETRTRMRWLGWAVGDEERTPDFAIGLPYHTTHPYRLKGKAEVGERNFYVEAFFTNALVVSIHIFTLDVRMRLIFDDNRIVIPAPKQAAAALCAMLSAVGDEDREIVHRQALIDAIEEAVLDAVEEATPGIAEDVARDAGYDVGPDSPYDFVRIFRADAVREAVQRLGPEGIENAIQAALKQAVADIPKEGHNVDDHN
ncbi:MAG: hypothetical protein KAY24_00340 [Candidatus Eisenbacteria sp.]|nr:hypothetical protein [Candidatus Eisenbacteria bacterium]